MEETKSKWSPVVELMQKHKPIELGKYFSYWFYHTPRRMLHCMSYYKFASKLIGPSKKVLDVGCNEGIGTYLLAKECGFAQGVDFDSEAIASANKNFREEENLSFLEGDFFQFNSSMKFDAVVNFDVIEHIYPKNVNRFYQKIQSVLTDHGAVVIGTPSEISQKFASPISKKGHVNIYSAERLEEEMKRYFSYVFIFSANDEVVHTGYSPLAHYFLAVGCKKITQSK